MLLVIGVVLLLGAAILAPLAIRAVRRWSLQRGMAEVRPRALATCAGRQVSVSGTAVPGPNGAIESGLASAECVWHGHEVLRHYWALTRSPETAVHDRERASDSIADYGSSELFGIVGPGNSADGSPVLIDPEDAALSGAHMCLQRVVGRPQPGVPAQADDLLPRVKGKISGLFRGETIEFEYREWVLRPGDPIVVHGRLEMRDGRPVITAPLDGRLRIEQGGDRPEAPSAHRATDALLLSGSAVVTACTGVLLVFAGA
ncbi:GIDE domain-containing protein [Nocardiopsis gilva]|uniref:GIDE domain-containing protein n=1 Tax=Nocardiopsis gilva TaxID=280236 RepID=UPI00034A9B72|nr:GIDE domain-containing protein [Nocardiopsis gilva]